MGCSIVANHVQNIRSSPSFGRGFLEGQDVFLSVPTGYGKSVCFQEFPYYYKEKHGTDIFQVIVISALIASMREQVSYLNSFGMPSLYITFTGDIPKVKSGKVNFVFTSPKCY